ncbi:MAG: fibronectin type III domain-containing protein, partial [Thermoplasmata archaeon]
TISAPTADDIYIVDTPGFGASVITDQDINVGKIVTGYAAAYNDSIGYYGDVLADWSVVNTTTNASTAPMAGSITSTFYSGYYGGTVDWTADFGGVTYTVTFTVPDPGVDYILIVDNPDTGATEIPGDSMIPQDINVGLIVTGYAAGFNDTIGYLYDVSAAWSVNNQGATNASTPPGPGTSSTFYSGYYGDMANNAIWTADFGGITDTVEFRVNPPELNYIKIVDTQDAGETEIPNQTVAQSTSIDAYAAGFNYTIGYFGDVDVTWVVDNFDGANAGRNPTTGNYTEFNSGPFSGNATLTAVYGPGIDDTVDFEISPWTVDYIQIVDTENTGATVVPDQTDVEVGYTMTGYAAAFSNSKPGYIYDVDVDWIVINAGSSAFTFPTSGLNSEFNSSKDGGDAQWLAAYYYNGQWYNDTANFTVTAPEVDDIYIVDTPGTGGSVISDQSIQVGQEIRGYAAAFNDSVGYIGDIDVDWDVTPSGGSNASTFPLTSSDWSDFYSGFFGGSADWEASDGVHTYTVTFTIPEPSVDSILIVDSPGTGEFEIPYQDIGVGLYVTGYAAAFNSVIGYFMNVEVSWSPGASGGANATTSPMSGSNTSTFFSGYNGGAATWTATYAPGVTDDVVFTILDPVVNYILIVEAQNTGTPAMPNQAVDVGFTIDGYAASFNYTIGYLGDVSADWDVDLGSASTNPDTGITSEFSAGIAGGTATWTATYAPGVTDDVVFTVNDPTVDSIMIVDMPDTGDTAEITDMTVGVGVLITGYAASFNTTAGYLGDIQVDWSVTPAGTEENASTSPATDSDTSDFYSGFYGGTVTWEAEDDDGHTDTVTITISPPETDYVRIHDAPGGTGNYVASGTYIVGGTDLFYFVAFNSTTGFLGDITAIWSITPTSGVGSITPTGHETNFTADQVSADSTCTITAQDPATTISNTTGPLTVLMPRIDEIRIMDAAGNAGSIVGDRTYGAHDTDDTFYAAGFNTTVGVWIQDVSASWSSDDTDVGTVDPETGTSTAFEAQDVTADDSCVVTATYQGISATTGSLTVLAPTVDSISLRDTAGGAGSEVTALTIEKGDSETVHAAGYNATSGFVMDVEATWSTDIGTATTPGTSTTLSTTARGSGTLTATYSSLTDTATVTVVDTTPPTAPGPPTVKAEDGKVRVDLPADPPADVARYVVEKYNEETGQWEEVANVTSGTPSFTDEDVKAGEEYQYRVKAIDDAGNPSNPSPATTVKVPEDEEDMWWLWLLLIIIIIIVLLLIFLLTRKKKEEEEEIPAEAAPPEEMPLEEMPEEEVPMEEEMPEEEVPFEEGAPEEAAPEEGAVEGAELEGAAPAVTGVAPPPPPAGAEEEAAPETMKCPSCGGEMEYIEDYDQHYCYNCGKYDSEFDEDEGGEDLADEDAEKQLEELVEEDEAEEGVEFEEQAPQEEQRPAPPPPPE